MPITKPVISHQRKFVFVHVPKAGGTSVEKALLPLTEGANGSPEAVLIKRNCNPFRGPPWLQHLTAQEYLRYGYVSPDDWKRYTTFAVVRNPWARMVSEYNARGKTRTMKLLGLKWTFRNFLLKGRPRWYEDNYLKGTDNFRHVLPQAAFLFDRDGAQMVSHVIRLEDVDGGALQPVLQAINVESLPLERLNRSQQRMPDDGNQLVDGPSLSYRDYYDRELRDVVEQRYAMDAEALGYSF